LSARITIFVLFLNGANMTNYERAFCLIQSR
jgi:hypothetical protein